MKQSTSQVGYGLTIWPICASHGPLTLTLVTSHTVTLSGLMLEHAVSLTIACGRAMRVGNERIERDATFTTTADNVPPVISAVAASPSNRGATITWTTDEASTILGRIRCDRRRMAARRRLPRRWSRVIRRVTSPG